MAASRSIRERLRNTRHKLYDKLPFVKRKRYLRTKKALDDAYASINEHLREKRNELAPLADALLTLPHSISSNATVKWIKPAAQEPPSRELCLFVTHAAQPTVKLHVVDHIGFLKAEGIAVALIINTDIDHQRIEIPSGLMADISACIVRQNVGFDFAAWSHAFKLLNPTELDRLYLVNDSIVGPLRPQDFSSMIGRIRSCTADLVGLTQNRYPQWHLQSFFLTINKHLLVSQIFRDLFTNIVNLGTKESVIEAYETRISAYLLQQGFSCQSVFAYMGEGSPIPDDTHGRWAELIEGGFPYIKASILKKERQHPKAMALIPSKYLAI